MAGKPGLEEFKQLLATSGLPDLGPGPRADILPQAALSETLDDLLSRSNLPSVSCDLIRALILLWHDRMDAAHAIAQGIESVDGGFLHGIVHRREPDYGNATYWFRRVGGHACYPEISMRVAALLKSKNETSLPAELVPRGKWDPFAFIQLCEKFAGKSPTNAQEERMREVQGIESEVLLEHFLNS